MVSLATGTRRGVIAVLGTALAVAMLPRPATAAVPGGFSEAVIAAPASPTAMEFAPDGRLFVSEQAGTLRVVKNDAMLPTPFVTLDVDAQSERGLLGIAFDPAFTTNHFIYVYYTAKTPTSHNRISRFTANGDVAVPGSEQVIVELPTLGSLVHNGGDIHFGADGKLYVPVGDNASPPKAQLLTSPLGKVLRFNADGTIPADNPFYAQTTGINQAIWALGFRNPFTAAVQPGTGRYYVNDVGEHTWEEVNEVTRGANLGWPTVEGVAHDARFTDPVFAYGHGTTATTGCAITAGVFYNPRTARFPAQYVGQYFFGDYCGSWVRQLNPANATVAPFGSGFRFVVDLAVSPDGHLFVLTREDKNPARVTRISYDSAVPPAVTSDPAPQTVAVGDPVSFSVSASGTPPLAYQWQRDGVDIPGATAATYTIAATALADDNRVFRARVTNGLGSDTSAGATLRVLDNAHPVATIVTPHAGDHYNAADTISYSGTGTDAEDGDLPPSAFTWEVVFHHADHVHPFLGPVSGQSSGSFVVPVVGEVSADVFFRIHLTVVDSAHLTHHVTRDVLPNTVQLSLGSDPAGLRVTLDGQPVTTPATVTGVVGMTRELGVVSPQDSGGKTWEFASWSDGGTASHQVTLPASPVGYTAAFTETTGIRFRSSAANGDPEGRSAITIGKPAGTATGDVLVASIVVNDQDPALVTPAGWTPVRQDTIPGKLRQAVYTRVAGAAEPAAYTWSLASDFRRLAGGISAYQGVDTGHPVDVSGATVATVAGTAVEAPSVTTTVPGTRLVHLAAVNAEGQVTPPATMAERYEASSPNPTAARDALAEASDAPQPAAGPTGVRAATAGMAGVRIGAVLALRPAGSVPPTGAISVVASASSGSSVGRQSITLPRPAGTLGGDVLVASIVVNSDDAPLTAPAGWAEVRQGTVPGALRLAVYTHTAGAGEPAGYTWTTTQARRLAGGVTAYRGVSATSPVDVSGITVDAGADTAVEAPSVTTTVAGTRLIHLVGINAEGAVAPPAGGSERYDVSSPNPDLPRDALAEASDSTLAAAGPSGVRTATAANAGVHIGVHVALRPA
ncbi:PQQ-dependent sugar dehydrogenase [Longispora sp. K20-0274]|uniref:PQQ-dependent sugar dehydrogenase n=1 Tax=Longispora sp. K20-0274 TaxID=3088255 RepID=UPI003999A25A